MSRHTKWLVALGLTSAALIATALLHKHPTGRVFSQIVGSLVLGWYAYLVRVLPQVKVAWDGVATAVICLAAFAGGSHLFLRWFYAEIARGTRANGRVPGRWKFGWTGALVVLVVLMFVAGLAATGIVHQVGWVLQSPTRKIQTAVSTPWLKETSKDRLRMIWGSLAMTIAESAEWPLTLASSVHSWQTRSLPGLYYFPKIQGDVPWNDARNAAYFRGIVPTYLNPDIPGPTHDHNGYAASHYAGNVHVLGGSKRPQMGKEAPGASQICVVGEVVEHFKAWGDPANLRDPMLGINAHPDGFGGPSGSGAYFAFLDGSVRLVRKTTDSKILATLSGQTPDHSP